ncbi:uncharacterized protein LOC123313156 [Coccinella septempunctata]|uniref:uncharacterized protein LOC123313156 n=1 Tax=Coccinella septempunctata TaxID=41139 RepID=UPI001D07ACF1|nr:uncharacterized protein LOC123313156 [Coccinella septempunctata]
MSSAMSTWRTSPQMKAANSPITTGPIPIRGGIFQGDSLSPLCFCISLNPESYRLNSTEYGFAIKCGSRTMMNLNHLFYMDDFKHLASTKKQMQQMLKMVEEFSEDIKMKFGLEKCRLLNIMKGKIEDGTFKLKEGAEI